MTDHKFEPFQQVLVRDGDGSAWNASFFSHIEDDSDYKFMACGMFWKHCIPYTPETAHLLGTSQPYEPPKPPQEYVWGQKVEVPCSGAGDWEEAVYIHKTLTGEHVCTPRRLNGGLSFYTLIRPLPDDTAAH